VFTILFAESVREDLKDLRVVDRRKILDDVEKQLQGEPGRATRRRKLLVGLVPPFDAVPPVWQLSVGEFRVFYDLDEQEKAVYVRAVRRKPPHKTTKEIL
jgi:mRNA-degrading endonuclease RelE of RelBE toxin-antitoxin system